MSQKKTSWRRSLHGLIPLAGKRIQDVHPVYAHITNFLRIGTPCPECPSCRKKFTAARRPRRGITLFKVETIFPIAISFRLCGACVLTHNLGGEPREAMLAAVEGYVDGVTCE